jgi:hypothetical protein
MPAQHPNLKWLTVLSLQDGQAVWTRVTFCKLPDGACKLHETTPLVVYIAWYLLPVSPPAPARMWVRSRRPRWHVICNEKRENDHLLRKGEAGRELCFRCVD